MEFATTTTRLRNASPAACGHETSRPLGTECSRQRYDNMTKPSSSSWVRSTLAWRSASSHTTPFLLCWSALSAARCWTLLTTHCCQQASFQIRRCTLLNRIHPSCRLPSYNRRLQRYPIVEAQDQTYHQNPGQPSLRQSLAVGPG